MVKANRELEEFHRARAGASVVERGAPVGQICELLEVFEGVRDQVLNR